VNFTGSDQVTIEVCDDLGECAQNVITIQVDNVSEGVKVYNAVAPNSTGDNLFMRIHNLPEGNKVSIYNRWGDKVFEVQNYDNSLPGKRFEGKNNNGNPLPSGTYFYRIEIPDGSNLNGPELITGYLALKQ
jgi:gliding motility-associated-like protein